MAEEFSKATLDNKMRQIESLLERADHPSTPAAEADSARVMAERLMVKYRIEESTLIERGDLKVDGVAVQNKVVFVCPADSKYELVYRKLASYALHHVGGRGVLKWKTTDEGVFSLAMHAFAYEADMRYFEMLFNNARMIFAARMEPRRDAALSDEDNVYAMRSAGMERIRIAEIMGYGTTNSATAKVTRLYKKACEARGEDATLTGRGNSVKDYRDVYAEEFTTTFWRRLYMARDAVEAEIAEGGLVLHGREERVKEAFYTAYPNQRPVPASRGIGENAKRRKVREYKETAADRKRMERRYSKAGQAGAAAGSRAANEVAIKGTTTPKRRLNEKG